MVQAANLARVQREGRFAGDPADLVGVEPAASRELAQRVGAVE